MGLTGLLAVGCSSELEVKGDVQRLIGERVTVALLEGDEVFSGQVELKDARNTVLKTPELLVRQEDDRTVSFAIPPTTAAGPATAKMQKKGSEATYDVGLTISRAAVALSDKGVVEALPLPPSTLKPATVTAGQTGQSLALTPGGDLLITLASDDVVFWSMKKTPTNVASFKLTDTRCIAALPSGVIVGTSTSIQLFYFELGKATITGPSLTTTETVALGVSRDGKRAIALTHCDTTGNKLPDSDCLVDIDLAATPPVEVQTVVLDNEQSATLLAIRDDGKGAVVADKGTIYGVTFKTNPAKVSTISWPGAKPVSIASRLTMIEDHPNDLFAVADSTSKTIRMIGFKGTTLQDVSQTTLDVPPTLIGFGRQTDLFVASGTKLLKIDASQDPPAVTRLSQQLSSRPIAFVVQP
ncbi:MAG: hypothetical protein CSA65_01290 [Proteobacteria bacterium]|nr:MAG: hypothetical protein CSA65_01290 [Pseudomonadota bacterium]